MPRKTPPKEPEEIPKPRKHPPETDPDAIPDSPAWPETNPDLIPDDDPFETPPAEIPEPGEGP